MDTYTLVATTTFGLEAVVKRELLRLGYRDLRVIDGRVEFQGGLNDIVRANLYLRCAERVFVKVAEFAAEDFDQLFEGAKNTRWEDWLSRDAAFTVLAKTRKSAIHSPRSCQSMVKKAIVERLKKSYALQRVQESGPAYTVHISIADDIARLYLDTSGDGLHKRGYRSKTGAAPIKETLASALVSLSDWRGQHQLLDPMCGSGTILIEAAQQACNIAPGLSRKFAAEAWPQIRASAWKELREQAIAEKKIVELDILGSDADPAVIDACRANAKKAGVAQCINFATRSLEKTWIDRACGTVITNPPYAERMLGLKEVHALYIVLNQMLRKKKGWSLYLITADKDFPNYFKTRPAYTAPQAL